MELEAIVTSLDGVPEAFRELYVQEGEEFRLNVTGVKFPKEIEGLERNKATILTEKKKLEEKLKSFDGVDLDAYKTYLEEKEQGQADKAKKEGDIQALLEQQNKRFEKEKSALQTQIEEQDARNIALTREIEQSLIQSELITAITKFDGNPDMLLPAILLSGKVRVVKDDNGNGKRVIRIMDGETVIVGDSKGTPMTVEQFVKTEYLEKESWGGAFKARGAGGSGASAGANNNIKLSNAEFQKLPPAERLKLARRAGKK